MNAKVKSAKTGSNIVLDGTTYELATEIAASFQARGIDVTVVQIGSEADWTVEGFMNDVRTAGGYLSVEFEERAEGRRAIMDIHEYLRKNDLLDQYDVSWVSLLNGGLEVTIRIEVH